MPKVKIEKIKSEHKPWLTPAILAVVAITVTMLANINSELGECGATFRRDYIVSTGRGGEFKAQSANTQEEQNTGLSGKKCIRSDEAMLFIFEKPSTYGFWMKDMNFPIDIIWLDGSKKVVSIESDVHPSTYPRIYYPSEPALFVLEVSAGASSQSPITIGQQLEW